MTVFYCLSGDYSQEGPSHYEIQNMNSKYFFPLLLIIVVLIFTKDFYDYKFLESINDWKTSINKRKTSKNPGYIGPWQVPKGVNKDSFTFYGGVCDPKGENSCLIFVKRSKLFLQAGELKENSFLDLSKSQSVRRQKP